MPGHAAYTDTFTNNTDHELSISHIAYFPLDKIFPSVNFTHVEGNVRSTTVTSDDGYSATITDNTYGGSFLIEGVGANLASHGSFTGLTAFYYTGLVLPAGWSMTLGYEFSFSTPEPGLSGFIMSDLVTAVPEPGTYAMLLIGIVLIGFSARRQFF
ncbi:MAG: PEP-CTERM sorting domain-containing protein [Nitrosomonas oligotropha]|uniref:PEP-CTERM sorting domain-containing protein n=1 Tax=Nitrosomonas oligotropha TaxID=42354 RepID=A0A5C7VU62_9PROT|nr:MAG: PEP-CTERM sorting domain-containing protein [Nitrosomonas oligotropha]